MHPIQGGQYQPLSQDQIKRVHEGVLRILTEAGVKVFTDTGLEAFRRAGADVDSSTRVVKLTRPMIEDAIASAPSRVVLCGRDPEHDAVLEGKNVYLGTGGTAINVLDLDTGRRRPSLLRDVSEMARLTDALENVHLFTVNVYPNDIDQTDDVDINRFYASLANTTKHVMGGVYSLAGVKQVVEMAGTIAGSLDALRQRPFVSFIALIISPLKIDDLYGEMTCYVARQGLPVVVPTEPLCGTTSPVTLASNVALACAESLAGVVMTQLINRGCPVIFGNVGSISNMRTLDHVSGAVERGMLGAAVAQMAQYYELPHYSTGGTSDAKVVDAQAAYESAMMNLLVAMSGANYIHDAAGLMEFDLTASYEKLVIDDEIIGMCMKVLRGIEVSDETLAIDLICRAGPGADFLGEMHTVEHMRTEFFEPCVADRRHREHWEAAGAKDTAQRARDRVRDILATHKPQPLPDEIDKAVRRRFPNLRCQFGE